MAQPVPSSVPPGQDRVVLFVGGQSLPEGVGAIWMSIVGVLAFAVLVLDYGFVLEPSIHSWAHVLEIGLTVCFVADRLLMLRRGPSWKLVLRQRFSEFTVLFVFAGAALIMFAHEPWTARLLSLLHWDSSRRMGLELLKLFLLANLLVQLLRCQQRILIKGARPEWILAGSFALLILAGTLLLLLPRASALPGDPLRPMDAFFTATSAACVTGLVVRDPGTEFSGLGQFIILVLFQVGGLGIMTFVAFLALTSAQSLPLANTLALRHLLSTSGIAEMKRHIWVVLIFTALFESLGAVLIFLCLPVEGDPLGGAWWSVFHAVSAFCNAGFALQADSLVGFQGNAGVLLTIMGLIILGGLGFLVVTDVVGIQLTRLPLIRRISAVQRFNRRIPVYRLPLQTRLSLLITGFLLVAGMAGFWILEARHLLTDQPFLNRVGLAAFQSVTCRTAGFNSVAIDALQPATLLLFMALMVIGASPVSTGGGIKTVTLGILILAMRALLTGRDRVEAFGRALPQKVVFAALSVAVLYSVAAGLGMFALALTDPAIPLKAQSFEVISALSTVGLSTGVTPGLSAAGKVILCVLMFVGRVGPLSLVLSMFRATPHVRFQYPEEDLVVG
jgi:potassium uptake TrkH family protein